VFLKKISVYIFCLFFSIKAYGASFTFPTTLTADTTGFVLVSNSGTTPAVNSKMLRKIDKDSGHENTFMIATSLAF
jgi:hypothetical protein